MVIDLKLALFDLLKGKEQTSTSAKLAAMGIVAWLE